MQWRETAARQSTMSLLDALRVLSAADPGIRRRPQRPLPGRRLRLSVAEAEAQIRRDTGR